MNETPTCAGPGCTQPLVDRRSDALCCSARCRLRLHRQRVRISADGYDPEADYRRRARTWDAAAELERLRQLDLQPQAAAVPLVDPADRLRQRRWQPLVDPTDPRRRRERSDS